MGQHPLGHARMLLIHSQPQGSFWGQGRGRLPKGCCAPTGRVLEGHSLCGCGCGRRQWDRRNQREASGRFWSVSAVRFSFSRRATYPRERGLLRDRVVPPCSLQVPRAVWCRRGLGGLGGGRGSGQGHGALGGLPEEGARLQQAAAEPRGPQAGWC